MSGPRVVAGRYRLEERIGSGAMGVVWRGTDERLGRPVAVKQVFLHGGLDDLEADEVRQRTLREGRIAARLQHPHAISVFDASIDGDEPWLVMEYLPSRSLAAVLAQQGPLDPRLVARIGRQVADALDAAHQAGIVHRDVKPGNVLIGADGTVKITDFGISRASGDLTLTRTGMLAGTPAYLAPEVARGDNSTPASDVFSLGATLYAAVEGVPPFGADDNALALLHAVAAGAVNPPLQAGPLTAMLMRLLRAEPGERPTADEARQQLGRIAKGSTADARGGRGNGRGDGRGSATRDDEDRGGLGFGFGTATGEHALRPMAPTGDRGDRISPNATRRGLPGPTEPWADEAGPRTGAGGAAAAPAVPPVLAKGTAADRNGGPPATDPRGPRRSGRGPDGVPPARRPSSMPRRWVAVGVLVAALVAGAVVGAVVLGRPSTSAVTNAPTGAAVGAPPAGPTSASVDGRAAMVDAVRSYYAVVTDNSGAGWARLGPGLQAGSGGFPAYQRFWSTMSSTRVTEAEAVDENTVRATVVFSPRSGGTSTEIHQLRMVRGADGSWLLDSDRLVPAGS